MPRPCDGCGGDGRDPDAADIHGLGSVDCPTCNGAGLMPRTRDGPTALSVYVASLRRALDHADAPVVRRGRVPVPDGLR